MCERDQGLPEALGRCPPPCSSSPRRTPMGSRPRRACHAAEATKQRKGFPGGCRRQPSSSSASMSTSRGSNLARARCGARGRRGHRLRPESRQIGQLFGNCWTTTKLAGIAGGNLPGRVAGNFRLSGACGYCLRSTRETSGARSGPPTRITSNAAAPRIEATWTVSEPPTATARWLNISLRHAAKSGLLAAPGAVECLLVGSIAGRSQDRRCRRAGPILRRVRIVHRSIHAPGSATHPNRTHPFERARRVVRRARMHAGANRVSN